MEHILILGGETFVDLLRDWNHWAFEIVCEFSTTIIVSPLIAWLVRRHDRRKHANGHKDG